MLASKIVTEFQIAHPNLVKAMRECSHHYDETTINPYHKEGDIFTHSMLVVHEMSKLYPDNHDLYAALLHDIGKPNSVTYDHEKKRKRFFGHEGMSTYMAIDLFDNSTDILGIILILNLISHHQIFFRSEENKSDLTEMFKGNQEYYAKLLKLWYADTFGRFVDEEKYQKSLEMYEYLKEKKLTIDSALPVINPDLPEVILMVGPPASGKSTYAKTLGLPILSRDDIVNELGGDSDYNVNWNKVEQKEVDRLFNSRLVELKRKKQSFVIDCCNMSRKSRRSKLAQISTKDFTRKAVVFYTGLKECLKRNEARGGKRLDPKIIHKHISMFCAPLYDEVDTIDYMLYN